MATLDFRLLPTLRGQVEENMTMERCVDTQRIIGIVRNKQRVDIVLPMETVTFAFPSESNAMLAFEEIAMVVRFIHADRVRIGEIPGLEGSEQWSLIIRKVDIASIEIVEEGPRKFVQLEVVTHFGRTLYSGRNITSPIEVVAMQGLLDAVFCS